MSSVVIQVIHGLLHVGGLTVGGHRSGRVVGRWLPEAEPQPLKVSAGGDLAGGRLEAGVGGDVAGNSLNWEGADILDLSMVWLWLVLHDVRELCQPGSMAVSWRVWKQF